MGSSWRIHLNGLRVSVLIISLCAGQFIRNKCLPVSKLLNKYLVQNKTQAANAENNRFFQKTNLSLVNDESRHRKT